MREKPGAYLWLTGIILLLIIIGIQANRKREPAKEPEPVVTQRKTPTREVEQTEEKTTVSEFVYKVRWRIFNRS